jgi:hypothetical protein
MKRLGGSQIGDSPPAWDGGLRPRLLRYAALFALPAMALLAGCGGTDERESNPRPPAPINVAVIIGEDEVDVSPASFGAGPIILVASNQSRGSHRLTIDGPQVKQSVGPINPQDTARLQVTVRPGEYTVSADGSTGLRPGEMNVGPNRESAQNQLQTP